MNKVEFYLFMHLKYQWNENMSLFITTLYLLIWPSEFGWNVYFDPKHSSGEKDEKILLQEEKSTVSPPKQITAVFKETESLTDEDSDDSNSGNPQKIPIRPICLTIYLFTDRSIECSIILWAETFLPRHVQLNGSIARKFK